MLLSTEAVSVAGARCLVRGTLHACDGRLAASIAQVAMVRTAQPGRD